MIEEVSARGSGNDPRFYELRSAELILLCNYLGSTDRPDDFIREIFTATLGRLARAMGVNEVPLETVERMLPSLIGSLQAENSTE